MSTNILWKKTDLLSDRIPAIKPHEFDPMRRLSIFRA